MKCTKIYNARAQLLFCSLNLLFSDVLVAVVVVVCLSSLLILLRLFARNFIFDDEAKISARAEVRHVLVTKFSFSLASSSE